MMSRLKRRLPATSQIPGGNWLILHPAELASGRLRAPALRSPLV